MSGRLGFTLLCVVIGTMLTGCGSTAPAETGFLSDYTRLEPVETGKMRYVSPNLAQYDVFIVDPVQLRIRQDSDLTNEQKAEVARYFHQRLVEVLQSNGYRVDRVAGAGTARVRLALTDAKTATMWMNISPISKLTGAGTGGAAMEGEVVDSVTGVQLAAVVQGGRGNQFELDTFDTIDDVEDVIDQWVQEAERRLRELRSSRPSGR